MKAQMQSSVKAVQNPSLKSANAGLLQRRCEKCGEKDKLLRRSAVGSSPETVPPIVHEVLGSPGAPLDASTRAHMESGIRHDFGKVRTHAQESVPLPAYLAIGRPHDSFEQEAEAVARRTIRSASPAVIHYDFSSVRVHNDALAAESARAVNASAYTVGHDIVFGPGRFTPGTQEGRRLIAHELTHVVQQSGADRVLANKSRAQDDLLSDAHGRSKTPAISSSGEKRILQRDIGFEFQTKNLVEGEKGRRFPRKFGEFLHKVPPTDKHGVEMQTDTGSVVEFETHHFRKWSDLETQIKNAVDIVKEIKKDPKAFPFNQQKRLATILRKGEHLEIDIKDPDFVAAIQYTEGFALAQYESALKEHERTEVVDPVIKKAQKILSDAQKANKKTGAGAKVDNLRGFLQVIIDYILNAQDRLSEADRVSPVKATFRLMSRTKFSSMFGSLLSADEQTLFKQIVKSDAIPNELTLSGTDQFFPDGYWGHLDEGWALLRGGKVIAMATEDKKTIHDCSSKAKTPDIDVSKCGKKMPESEITINGWLNSIVTQKTDKLSPPHAGSESMGKFEVRPKGEEKELVVFETRGETHRNRWQPADQWVDYAEDIFREAAVCRARPGTGTELIYDGKNKPFDPKNCP